MSHEGPSAPFADSELHGEVLVDELTTLRRMSVPASMLVKLAARMQSVRDADPSRAQALIRQLLPQATAGAPLLHNLIEGWVRKLKSPADVPALVLHVERLAITAAVLASYGLGLREGDHG